MAELIDPNKDPHEIIEVHGDGSALRNDGKTLKPARQNIWYVMMTAAGEQDVDGYIPVLHKENRRLWNGWACQGLNDEARQAVADDLELDVEKLARLSEDETAKLLDAIQQRTGQSLDKLPKIPNDLDLSQTYFSKILKADHFYFPTRVTFKYAVFEGSASFLRASFKGTASFFRASFKATARFFRASFKGGAFFSEASFDEDVNFSNGIFSAYTDFEGARFKKYVPEFYQCQMHDSIGLTTKLDHWPPIIPERADRSKNAYIWLRREMSRLQKFDDEHFFFRQIMRCKAELEGRFYKSGYQLYGALSDYGYSVGRPAACLLGLLVICGLIYGGYGCGMEGRSIHPQTYEGMFDAFAQSISHTFPFFGFQKLYFSAEFWQGLPKWIKFIGGMQTTLSFILLFLLGLGLRNRFRLR